MTSEIPTYIGTYRIIRKLGEGGMGAVYEARQELIERRVAIKLLHPGYARDAAMTTRFFNEARAVNLIEHPSLVQVSDYGRLPDGTAYIVMEYLGGETLAKRMLRLQGKLDLSDAMRTAWQVAAALAAAHGKGIVHRDLKPDNIMLVPEPIAPGGERIKLLDFGIAKLAQCGRGHTDSKLLMGTPKYMAPEQCYGASKADERSDVYSLGVILFEMTAGRPPFEAEESMALLFKHLTEPPPSLTELAPQACPGLVLLIEQLLTKDKEARPSMSQVRDRLGQLLGYTSTAPPLDPVQPISVRVPESTLSLTRLLPPVERSRSRSVWAASAALGGLGMIIIATVGVGWLLRPLSRRPVRGIAEAAHTAALHVGERRHVLSTPAPPPPSPAAAAAVRPLRGLQSSLSAAALPRAADAAAREGDRAPSSRSQRRRLVIDPRTSGDAVSRAPLRGNRGSLGPTAGKPEPPASAPGIQTPRPASKFYED